MKPRTIITYLINWNPTWLKTVEFSNRLIKWISIPRKFLKDSIKRDELNKSWIYFLIWENEKWENLAYIWQATILWKRLENHNKDPKKDFWNNVICFTNKDWSLTESDINYLEKNIISTAKNISRYEILNSTIWNNWIMPEHRISDMDEFFEDLKILLSNLWYSLLKELWKKEDKQDKQNIYYLKDRWSDSRWIYIEEWFLVLKWSVCSNDFTKSEISRKWFSFVNRPKLLNDGIIENMWNKIIFKDDYLFSSPSSASTFITWCSSNWWISWKDSKWNTLDKNERQ